MTQRLMRGLTHRWGWRNAAQVDEQGVQSVRGELVDRLLLARGISDAAAIAMFRDPRLSNLHSPDLLPGIETAAIRILDAIAQRQRIVIYGDYDADGITATAILYHTLRAIDPEANLHTYVPHRMTEGYGLSVQAINQIAAEGAAVIISVDCGVTACAAAAAARSAGVDLIITDHHNLPDCDDGLPECCAIVHPGLPGGPGLTGSSYPFRDLCGAGVAFKLAWKLCTTHCGSERVGDSLRQTLLSLLPLVALGTIADVVPLVDENRILTSIGLSLIAQSELPGIRALLDATGLREKDISEQRVGFILAPHLNASGRMDHASAAVSLLTNASEQECKTIANRLTQLNRDRQRAQRTIQTAAARLAEDRGMMRDDRRIIVLASADWHRGVVGIVCSRLVEMFGRPTILMQQDEGGICHGSARSIDGYSIAAALETCDDLLETHGGHDMAAGLSLRTDQLDAFTERINDHANENIEVAQLTPGLTIDCDVTVNELTVESVHAVERLAPFGRGNPRPIVCMKNMRISAKPRQIGSEGRHLMLQVNDDGGDHKRWLKTIWWDSAKYADSFAPGVRLDLAIEPKLNHYNGRCTVEGVVRDARPLGGG